MKRQKRCNLQKVQCNCNFFWKVQYNNCENDETCRKCTIIMVTISQLRLEFVRARPYPATLITPNSTAPPPYSQATLILFYIKFFVTDYGIEVFLSATFRRTIRSCMLSCIILSAHQFDVHWEASLSQYPRCTIFIPFT